jgi:hypothetical protein
LTALVATYLVLLWVAASAAARGWGVVVFGVGLVALAAASAVARRGRRRPLYRLYYLVLMAASLGLAVELLLRLFPGIVYGSVADAVYTGYHWGRNGIYRLDDHEGPVIRPGFERTMFWAGRRWRHAANADGYRGPAVARADAVFLGDSLVYGHGVEEAQTLSARFGARTGLSVANLGVQGTCPVQAWMVFQRLGVRLRPARVFVCVHYNDVEDAGYWYSPEELRRFIESPADAPYEPFVKPSYRPKPWWNPWDLWSQRLALPMLSARLGGALARSLLARGLHFRAAAAPLWVAPTQSDIDGPFTPVLPGAAPADVLGWKANVRSLLQIRRLADRTGARLLIFDVGYPRAFSAAVEAAARQVGAEYSPAGRVVLEGALRQRPMYLPGDGHWTSEGNDLVAAELIRSAGL